MLQTIIIQANKKMKVLAISLFLFGVDVEIFVLFRTNVVVPVVCFNIFMESSTIRSSKSHDGFPYEFLSS